MMGAWLKTLASAPATSRASRYWYAVYCVLMAAVLPLAAVIAVWLYLGIGKGAPLVFLATELVLIVATAAALAVFSILAELSGQHARDIDASDLMLQLKRGVKPPRPFTLYLRPFATTDEIDQEEIGPAFPALQTSAFAYSSTRYELEQQIERASRRVGPLVGLGRPMEHVGAGRIRVADAEWKQAIELLTDHSALIVLLPSSRLGTSWEVQRILDSDLVRKTVMIDPPNRRPGSSKRYRQDEEWGQVRAQFAQHGYKIPEDSKVGRMLYFGNRREPVASARLDMDSESNMGRFFRQVSDVAKPQQRNGDQSI